jgi:hypothetical protein
MNKWVWSNGGMIPTEETEVPGEKHYTAWVVDVGMNEYRALLLLLSGTELPLMVESFGLLNILFPFPSILDIGYPVFDLHLANALFDVILPSVLGSSL